MSRGSRPQERLDVKRAGRVEQKGGGSEVDMSDQIGKLRGLVIG